MRFYIFNILCTTFGVLNTPLHSSVPESHLFLKHIVELTVMGNMKFYNTYMNHKMHKILVIRLYFLLDALHVSDYISPSSGATL